MPEYLSPGVYIEEIERGPRPIEGVPTSTAAFLGETERGPLRPRLVTSYNEYLRWFGSVFADARYMPHAASGFFDNGGKRLYVSRIVGEAATAASKVFGEFTVEAVGPGAWGSRVWVRVTRRDARRRRTGRAASACSWPTGPRTRRPSGLQSVRSGQRATGCRGRRWPRTTTTCRSIRSIRTSSRSA